ncbi:hypothetical protein [Spirosoma utsteinense]|uniref:hypothetical protein n=1 Tax=Spirosoma utsteinense TaxID=2585773 RepID=UPI001646CD56|nr:hypothetical protein [Spirosoma utsteinense]MBC3787324.1 hypothetical protein [Spirosoma utsteinense]
MKESSTWFVSILLIIVVILILIPIGYLLLRFVNTARDDREVYESKDYFYLFINGFFPFLMLGAEGALKWFNNSTELGSFWIIGTISAAIGLLLGNVKPKELITNQAQLQTDPDLHYEFIVFHKRDNNIMRWCWLLLFVEFVFWVLASIAVTKNELFDFWTNLILTIAIYGVSLYMSYRKELV